MKKSNKSASTDSQEDLATTGMALGMAFGAAFGVVFDNLAISIALGMSIGLAIGTARQAALAKKSQSDATEDSKIR